MKPIRYSLAWLLAGAMMLGVAQAAPVTFDFTFSSEFNNAQAVGSITFDDAQLQNPGDNSFHPPYLAVLALNVTVSGATAGNGTFTLDDFCEVNFDTNGGTLDFSQELVGQPTNEDPWGSSQLSGDFSLGACTPNDAGAPTATEVFELMPDDDADPSGDNVMRLVSMTPSSSAPVTVPTLGWQALLLLAGLMGLFGLWTVRRRV